MRPIEQIAIKTLDIDDRIRELGPEAGVWIRDEVSAVTVYPEKNIGDLFGVQLAFNYTVIPTRELELIRLLSGTSVQLMQGEPGEGLSHLGYHTEQLFPEIEYWHTLGYPCVQISATVRHLNTERRYLYAFIDTRVQIGSYTKVIQRMDPGIKIPNIESLIEEYSHVSAVRI